MKRWTLKLACVAAVLGLAACGIGQPGASHGSEEAFGQTQGMHAVSSATLQAYQWTLDKAEDASGRELPQVKALALKHAVRLDFQTGGARGEHRVSSQVCNRLQAPYTLTGERIQVERVISTRMACPDRQLMQLEQIVVQQMERMQSVRMVRKAPQPRLVVTFIDGSRWHMSGKPSAATRHSRAGETIFLEVGPQTRPCVPGEQGAECLQVRELRYDKAGRQSIASDWQHFHGSIDGFTFQPGVRKVLRLKRQVAQHTPADRAAPAYVLERDMETEVAQRR